MWKSRRSLLMTLVGATGAFAAEPLLAASQSATKSTPHLHPYPNGRDPNAPELDEPRVVNQKALELQNREKLRLNIAKLYEMVSDFKEQVEKTDSNSTLSVALVKKAQQIEKLAKQIKDLATS